MKKVSHYFVKKTLIEVPFSLKRNDFYTKHTYAINFAPKPSSVKFRSQFSEKKINYNFTSLER